MAPRPADKAQGEEAFTGQVAPAEDAIHVILAEEGHLGKVGIIFLWIEVGDGPVVDGYGRDERRAKNM